MSEKLNTAEYAAMLGGVAATTAGLVAASIALDALMNATSTSIEVTDITGKKELHPTKQNSELQRSDTNAVKTTASGANDSVSGQDGALEGNSTKATAAKQQTQASESGATALDTEAGATEIATKALKMN